LLIILQDKKTRGQSVALDPPVPHVATHWFVLTWWWVFHIASMANIGP